MSTPKGWPTQEKDQRLIPQFATVEPVHTLQHGLSVLAHQYVYEVATATAEAGSSAIAIIATASGAQAGDVIRLTSGALSGREIKVYEVSGTTITLAEELPSAVAAGVTFQILRHKYPLVEPTGEVKISGSFSTTEEATAADGGALPAKVKVAGGYDGSSVQVLKTDSNGELQVDVLSTVLPTNAATETTLNLAKNSLADIAKALNDSNNTPLFTKVIVPGYVNAASSGVFAIQGDSFNRLRTGAAITDTTGTQAATVASGRLSVDGSGVTQPVSNAALTSLDGKFGSLGQKAMSGSAPVVIASDQTAIPVSGTITTSNDANGTPGAVIPTEATMVGGSDGTNLRSLKTDANGELQIDVLSSALPTGAATEATLSALSAKIPALASSGGIPVEVLQQDGLLDTGNTTAVALGAGGVFTGTWKDGTNWSAFQLGVFSDQASATNGLNVQFSYDGVSVHHNHYYTYAGGSNGIGYAFPVEFRYFRVVYTNNAVAQATFRLITVLKANSIQPSQYRLTNALSDETQASVTRSLIFGKTTGGGGGYVDVKVNPSGALAVDATVTSSTLPTGAATEATLSALNTKVPSQGQALMASSVPVVIASNQSAIPVSGSFTAGTLTVVDLLDAGILDTSSTNIPGSASSPVQVIATTAATIKALQLLDTTGAFVGVYVGGSGSEVLQLVMGPGSDQTIEHTIASGSRVSLKRLDSTTAISSGIVAINCLG